MKKEQTIEQASEYYAHNYFDMHETNNYKALKEGFIVGAKWQQERMYSEEDLKEAFDNGRTVKNYKGEWQETYSDEMTSCKYENFKDWFEKFKNK